MHWDFGVYNNMGPYVMTLPIKQFMKGYWYRLHFRADLIDLTERALRGFGQGNSAPRFSGFSNGKSLLQLRLVVFPSLGHQGSLPGATLREHPFH